MIPRDRRFRTYRTYTVHKVKWTRRVNLALGRMTWTCRTLHPVRIIRDKFGRYVLSCDEHKQFATTRRLDRAFRTAAVHMGHQVPTKMLIHGTEWRRYKAHMIGR